MRTPRRIVTLIAGLGLLVGAAAAPAGAGTRDHKPPPSPRVVASGLDAPRHLSFSARGDLYIAESGTGGTDNCIEHPELGTICLGETGAITKLSRKGHQQRVVTGLPSVGAEGEGTGPSDVLVRGNRLIVVIGLGGDEDVRASLGPDAALLGTVVSVKPGKRSGTPRVLADPVAYETKRNPDGGLIDSNPVDLARNGSGYLVTDAGGNDVLKMNHKGRLSTAAVLPTVWTDPPFPGAPDPFPAEPVPTAAAKGPDGAWYIAQLTGFPFEAGSASIYRLKHGKLTTYATGLTNVTDLAWSGKSLYAVQISDEGLLAGPSGSLVKVSKKGDHRTVADDLFAPYGVAIRHGYGYVTTCSVCAGGGEVLKVKLGR